MRMTVKINVRIGDIEFGGEGTESWIEKQLEKVMEYARNDGIRENRTPDRDKNENVASGDVPNLVAYLKSKSATSKQVLKFLATANWLHLKGTERLKTSDISNALNENNQGKLANPSDALRQNIAKGHCERDGANFFVTPEGRDSLGI
jgi:hypothetical protein